MKNSTAWITFFCVILFSCSSRQQKTPPDSVPEAPVVSPVQTRGQVISAIPSQADPSQSYALYLPLKYADTAQFPVMIFFDPHGDGRLPLNLYKDLAEQFGIVLIGSNSSKNGLQFEQTNLIVGNLVNEATRRFSAVPQKISLAGFSGGAKVALVAASVQRDVCSVIYCGAAVPFTTIQSLPPALGLAGIRDMNYMEVGQSSGELYSKNLPHAMIEWNGKHEWPDAGTFEDAFYWSAFQAMANKSMPVNRAFIESFVKKEKHSLAGKASSIEKVNTCSIAIAFLHQLTDVSDFRKTLETISRSPSFQSEMQKRQTLFSLETNLKTNYTQCFESKDLGWWQDEIKRMRTVQGDEELMYQRLLGYLSLASYSYSAAAIKQNNREAARQYLGIYKLADPGNPEQPFLEACLFARNGDTPKAMAALQHAVDLGLKDRAKLEAEDSFQQLRGNADFISLLNKM